MRIVVLKLDLVHGDGVAEAIEDEEAGGGGALVDAAHEPVFLELLVGLGDARGEVLALGGGDAGAFGVSLVGHCVFGSVVGLCEFGEEVVKRGGQQEGWV